MIWKVIGICPAESTRISNARGLPERLLHARPLGCFHKVSLLLWSPARKALRSWCIARMSKVSQCNMNNVASQPFIVRFTPLEFVVVYMSVLHLGIAFVVFRVVQVSVELTFELFGVICMSVLHLRIAFNIIQSRLIVHFAPRNHIWYIQSICMPVLYLGIAPVLFTALQ